MTTKRSEATNVDDLLIDPAGHAENELLSLFAATPTRSNNSMDSMSARCIAASKPVVAKGFARQPGWLDKRPA